MPLFTLALLLAGTFSVHAVDAGSRTAAPAVAKLSFTVSTALKNSGVAAGATGKLSEKYARSGTVVSQQFKLSLNKLLPSTPYPLAGIFNSDTAQTSIASTTSDAKGKASVSYSKTATGSKGTPLPDALNPLINLRELDVLGSGQTLLSVDITHADKYTYSFKGPMTNTGAIPLAVDTLQIKGTPKSTKFGLKVAGLPPMTDFLLAINVTLTQKVTSDLKGKLNLKALPAGSPNALGIHTVTLSNNTSGVVALVITGLGVPPDTAAPRVLSTSPADLATAVPTNAKVSALFSKAVNGATITSANFTLAGPGTTAVAGTISYDAATHRATFTPTAALAVATVYTANLAAGVQDFSGNASASNTTWTFTSGAAADTAPPFVTSTNPVNGATAVPVNRPLMANFNEPMDASTINTTTFTLQGATAVSGTVTYSGTTATFTPTGNLTPSTTYTATVTTQVMDVAGNEMASTYTWTFTTGANASAGPAPVALGSSSAFAVLAGSTVTSVGPTTLTGDLGVSPGSAVTGFPPGIVTGATHAGDNTAAQAKNDLLAAYNDSAARLGSAVLPGNVGGLTFTPGLYKNSTSTMLSGTGANGIVTLDAQGDSNAVFIFQMGSTLTTDPGTQVVLSGGAKAANVYWQVGTSATIGTTCNFKGNILADQSITLTTGATLEGRALTRIGAVSLDSNSITTPAP